MKKFLSKLFGRNENSNGQECASVLQETAQSFVIFVNKPLQELRPDEAFSLFIDFYEAHRPSDVRLEPDSGDMLLFQYGVFDWGDGEKFDLDLTRQFSLLNADGDYLEMWQLHLTFRYQVTPNLRSIDVFNVWFDNFENLANTRDQILNSKVVELCSRLEPVEVVFDLDSV